MGIAITYAIANLAVLGMVFMSLIDWPKNREPNTVYPKLKNIVNLICLKCGMFLIQQVLADFRCEKDSKYR